MEYAFVPGPSTYDAAARELFALRPNTQLVPQHPWTTVHDFLTVLGNGSALTPPVQYPTGDLHVVSHGNDRAWMTLPLDTTQLKETTFEVVQAAVASGSVHFPAAVNQNVTLNIRGCQIGSSPVFVDLLKQAFGGTVTVTAPRHFHAIGKIEPGRIEYLLYGFTVVARDEFADKKALAQAFADKHLTYRDGTTAVPAARWPEWLPDDVSIGQRDRPVTYLRLGRKLFGNWRYPAPVEFWHATPTFSVPVPGLPQPPTDADKLTALRDALHRAATQQPGSYYSPTHPFPIFKRFGYDTLDLMIDGMTWTYTWQPANPPTIPSTTLYCVGTQHVYILRVPITDTSDLKTGKLIYNFFSSAAGPNVTELRTSDATLFYTS